MTHSHHYPDFVGASVPNNPRKGAKVRYTPELCGTFFKTDYVAFVLSNEGGDKSFNGGD